MSKLHVLAKARPALLRNEQDGWDRLFQMLLLPFRGSELTPILKCRLSWMVLFTTFAFVEKWSEGLPAPDHGLQGAQERGKFE